MLVQVAAQEGSYLANCFNRMKICEENPEGPVRIRGEGRHRFKPFRFVFHVCYMYLQQEYSQLIRNCKLLLKM